MCVHYDEHNQPKRHVMRCDLRLHVDDLNSVEYGLCNSSRLIEKITVLKRGIRSARQSIIVGRNGNKMEAQLHCCTCMLCL